MPKRKTPQPLYRLCVAYVVEHIERLCPPHDAVGSVLTPPVNEDLLGVLKRVKRSTDLATLQHILLHPLRRIELRFDDHCPHPPNSWPLLLLSSITQQGKQLVELSLDEPSLDEDDALDEDDSALVDAMSKLPRLRMLALCIPNVSDRVVVSIAEHCRELCELKLSGGCLTDESLCQLVACSQLRTLLLGTNMYYYPLVTVASALQLLRGLRHLRRLEAPFLADALLTLPADCRLLLAHCTLRGVSHLWESTPALAHIVSVCPQLTCVDLHVTSQDSIVALVQLKALAELTLRADFEPDEDLFYREVEPVLRAVGPKLRKLALSLQYLDLAAVSRHCPALVDLEVEDLWTLTIMDQLCADPSISFQQLQRLKFFPMRRNTVKPEQLFQILSGCNQLIWVTLGFCELTDALLKKLVKLGTFSKLRKLKLHAVREISAVGLQALMLADSELAALTVVGCEHVMWDDIEDLWNHVANDNLDLLFKYGVV